MERPDDERENRALHGLVRSLVNNMVVGVTEGFTKELEISRRRLPRHGPGPDNLELALGFSHPVEVEAPEGITFEVPSPTRIVVKGIDKERSARSPPTSARSASPSPTRARASATSASTSSRKAGKTGEVSEERSNA